MSLPELPPLPHQFTRDARHLAHEARERILVAEIERLRAEREAMRGALLGAIDLAQFWIDRCKAPVMTQAEYNSWVSLGHQSKAMRAAIDAARSAP